MKGNKIVRRIVLTDEMSRLRELVYIHNLEHEAESRWNPVEVIWELGVSPSLLVILYDGDIQVHYGHRQGVAVLFAERCSGPGHQRRIRHAGRAA